MMKFTDVEVAGIYWQSAGKVEVIEKRGLLKVCIGILASLTAF